MDSLTLFGLFAVVAMLVFYVIEDRSHWYILAFACLLASLYGFLQGAWPFGIVEVVWSGVAVYRWRIRTLLTTNQDTGGQIRTAPGHPDPTGLGRGDRSDGCKFTTGTNDNGSLRYACAQRSNDGRHIRRKSLQETSTGPLHRSTGNAP
jgi:hypothetical protein